MAFNRLLEFIMTIAPENDLRCLHLERKVILTQNDEIHAEHYQELQQMITNAVRVICKDKYPNKKPYHERRHVAGQSHSGDIIEPGLNLLLSDDEDSRQVEGNKETSVAKAEDLERLLFEKRSH